MQVQHYKLDDITVDGVIRPTWRDVVIETAPDGDKRVNRINYELCVLESLREQVRCKEIWVAGAERFRNPDEDLPSDFGRAPHHVLPAAGAATRGRHLRRRSLCRNGRWELIRTQYDEMVRYADRQV